MAAVIFCLLSFATGCSEEIDFEGNEEDLVGGADKEESSGSKKNQIKASESVVSKALHDELMSKQEARWQELTLEHQNVQAQRDKLLLDIEKFDALSLELATTQEERERLIKSAQSYRASSQAAASQQSAANAQTVEQLKASNTQLSSDLASSEQRVQQLQVSVSRMQNPANMLKIRQLNLEKTFISDQLAERDQQIKELQDSLNDPQHQENVNLIQKLESQNKKLSQSLVRSEKKSKEMETSLNKPRNQGESNLIQQLKSQNEKLSKALSKSRQDLAKKSTPPKSNLKTLAEWKNIVKSRGLLNGLPTTNQLSASIGKPHDKADSITSSEYKEMIYIWRDMVKVDLEIHTTDGKIEKIGYAEDLSE